jgi:hypothetical protein
MPEEETKEKTYEKVTRQKRVIVVDMLHGDNLEFEDEDLAITVEEGFVFLTSPMKGSIEGEEEIEAVINGKEVKSVLIERRPYEVDIPVDEASG